MKKRASLTPREKVDRTPRPAPSSPARQSRSGKEPAPASRFGTAPWWNNVEPWASSGKGRAMGKRQVKHRKSAQALPVLGSPVFFPQPVNGERKTGNEKQTLSDSDPGDTMRRGLEPVPPRADRALATSH